jgi:hypothetical protein
MRNRVERFFRHLKKERTIVFHHKISARDHIQGINNLFTVYYQASRRGGEQKCLFGHYRIYIRARSNMIFYRCLGLAGSRHGYENASKIKQPPPFSHPAPPHTALINNKS